MQINTYQIENITGNNVVKKEQNENGVQASRTTGFLGVALGKNGILSGFNNNYIQYDKNGKENISEDSMQNTSDVKENMVDFINENIEKLKNLVTEEDYDAMSELGLAPDKEDPHTLVTVYERIQIELAAYCKDYNLSTMNISSDKIDTVINSSAMANSIKMAQDSGDLTDGTKSYLLKNDLEPTIANVYKASHSTGKEAQNNLLPDAEWEQLKPQIEDMIEKSGMEVNEENLNNAKWLMEQEIPVTVENLVKLNELNQVDMTRTDVLNTNVALALMMGMNGTDAFVTQGWIDKTEIEDTVEILKDVSDNAIYDIVNDDAVLNVANLQKYESDENHESDAQKNQRDFHNPAFIRAKNIIVEARLVMTSASLLHMQRLGISITYTEISLMVSEATEDKNQYLSAVGKTEGMTEMVSDVMDMMKSMSQIPSAVMGKIYDNRIEFTLSSVYEESNKTTTGFARAEMTYGAVGTQVRQDLGDSISKAFESLTGIMQEQGIDVNEKSKSAARILAYNEMEINQENVLRMECLMNEWDYVRNNLTPKTVALLVGNQVDILNIDIRKLNKNLVELNALIGADENEDFAKYLWKLEKNGNISKEERDAYVDLYRTLNRVDSVESRALGAVVSQGAEMTLNNLLSAVKSREKMGMDIQVDESFGMNDAEYRNTEQDMESIGHFVKRLSSQIKGGLNAENVEKVYSKGDFCGINLGNLVDVVSDNESLRTNAKLNAEYMKKVMDSYLSEASQEGISEEMVLSMVEGGHPTTMENIVSAMSLSTPGSEFRKYLLDNERKKDAAENLLEHLDDKESANEAMKQLKETAKCLEDSLRIDLSYEKIKSMAEINKTLRFMLKSAENESYHIPMDLGGEKVTVRVSFVHGEETGKATISMNTRSFGKIDCVIQSVNMVSNIRTEAIVYCETTEIAGVISGHKSIIIKEMGSADKTGDFSVEAVTGQPGEYRDSGKQSVRNRLYGKTEDENEVETTYLYKISKSFLKSVKECLDSSR